MQTEKPRIGAHVSIAGGINNAPERAKNIGCDTFQCFTRPPQGGQAPVLSPSLIESFKGAMRTNSIETFYIHAPYFINLASETTRIRESSIHILREELERGTMLGAGYLMAHVGSYTGQTLEAGIEKVINGILKILDDYEGTTGFLIEISAGSGNVIGDKFEELGMMVEKIKHCKGFSGICFDTCHAFGAGYDFRTKDETEKTIALFEQHVGLNYLKLTHVNDSKTPLGGRKDRHEHIGEGHIGIEGLANILTTPAFSKIDWLLETPDDKRAEDVQKLKEIRDKII